MSKSWKLKDGDYLSLEGIVDENYNKLSDSSYKNMSKAPYIVDCNKHYEFGQYGFNPDTLNSPNKQNQSFDSYGILININNSYDSSYNYLWVFQIAFGCNGNLFFRMSINSHSDIWSNWKKIDMN